jgi:Trk K+ transport system NAD-binding subunit
LIDVAQASGADPPAADGSTDDGPSAVEVIRGDGTSRLVLQRAGAADAGALLAVTGDDRANLECARLARAEFGIRRVLALYRDPSLAPALEALGVEAIDVATALAGIVLGRLDTTIRPAVGVGLGQGEIVEVTLLRSSPVIGRALRSLGAREWLVAAIFRQDHLLVPHGDTIFEPEDRVVLVGAPAALPGIAEYFRAGASAFPWPYGRRLAVVPGEDPGDRFWEEVTYLYAQTRAAGVDVFSDDPPPAHPDYFWHAASTDTAVAEASAFPGVGCLIVAGSQVGWTDRLGLHGSPLLAALRHASQPVLIARGTFPYRRLQIAATDYARTRSAAEVAVGLASLWEADLTGITASAPSFVVGARAAAEQLDALSEAAVLAQIHRVRLLERHFSGNPVRRLVACANADADLLIVGRPARPGWRPWAVDVAQEVASRVTCSTLTVPPWKR